MTFEVKLFAYLRQEHGESVVVEASGTVRELLSALLEMGIDTSACRVAVNHVFVTPDQVIQESDEIALIPPVSGG